MAAPAMPSFGSPAQTEDQDRIEDDVDDGTQSPAYIIVIHRAAGTPAECAPSSSGQTDPKEKTVTDNCHDRSYRNRNNRLGLSVCERKNKLHAEQAEQQEYQIAANCKKQSPFRRRMIWRCSCCFAPSDRDSSAFIPTPVPDAIAIIKFCTGNASETAVNAFSQMRATKDTVHDVIQRHAPAWIQSLAVPS